GAAGNVSDIELEILLLVEDGRPVQGTLRLARGIGLVEIGVLRNRAARARSEDPYDVVGQAVRVARGAGSPPGGRHASDDGRASGNRRIEDADRRVVELLP